MLQFVDPSVLYGDEGTRFTPFHDLADLADPVDYSTHENQLTLAKQLIKHGANVNAVSTPDGLTPLHKACYAGNVTNLDFVELLLGAGANTDAEDDEALTPLMYTIPDGPGAAKFLLNWPTTDVIITSRPGQTFLAMVRKAELYCSDKIALPDNPENVQHQFLLRQWRNIEDMLVERGP